MESFLEEADWSRLTFRGFQDLGGARDEMGKATALGQGMAQTRIWVHVWVNGLYVHHLI